MKKIGMILGVILGLFVAAALIVPLVVDVDKYRPQLLEMANKQIHGKLELGKLSLSLWGQIRVDVAGLQLLDSKGQELVGVKDAYFHIPFLPLLSGSPVFTFKMNQPTVNVVKDRAGQINFMSLVKKSEGSGVPAGQAGTPKSTPAAASPSAPTSLPGIVTSARLGIELKSALITYKDELTGLRSDVKDLNMLLRDISLTHPTELELWADLDTKLGQTFRLKGPARLVGKATPELKNSKIDRVSLTSKLNMDNVEMSAPGLFEKKKGMATNVEIALSASEEEARIEKFTIKFFNAEISAQGTITHLASTAPGALPVLSVDVKSNQIELKPWVELIPMLKEYELGGAAEFEADARGPSQKLNYHAKLAVKDITAKSPQLKAQPKIDGVISVITDQVDKISITMKAPGNDLRINGKVVSFSKPRLDFDVTSSGMNLDQLLVFPPPAQKGAAEKKPGESAGAPAESGGAAKAKATPPANYDAMLAPLRENKMLADASATISLKMAMIQAKGVKITDIGCIMTMKDLAMGLDKCGLKVFSGVIQADSLMQLKPKTPTYKMNLQVTGLDLSQAVASQMALFKDTVTGKASFKMGATGASFNPDPATSNLKANGNFKVADAVFATVDVGKMVGEALNKAIEKVPGAQGKKVNGLPSGGSQYEFISSDFTISDGKFSAPNFYAKAKPNLGIDLKGVTHVGMKDFSLDTTWDVIDTYNLTHARDISLEQNGVKVDHVLAEGNNPVHFPVHAGCTIKAPCYSYTDVVAFLGKIALQNMSAALSGKAKAELKKRAVEVLKQAPPAIQDKLKNFFN